MQTCTWCKNTFTIPQGEVDFLEKISPVFGGKKYPLPLPGKCSQCRFQRRLMSTNERKLYSRKMDNSGKMSVSNYSPDKPHTVYDPRFWFSDQWDPLQYGRDFDFTRPFFEQFRALYLDVPRIALDQGSTMINSEFNNYADHLKDCYYGFQLTHCERLLYCDQSVGTKDCVDCTVFYESEQCYNSVNCLHCYEVFFSRDVENCSSSMFLFDCVGCSHCLFCTNLRNKEYHIFNKPVSKEEFEKQRKAILSALAYKKEEVLETFQSQLDQAIYKFAHLNNSEHCTGDYISNSKNCINASLVDKSQDLKYAYCAWNSKDCLDINNCDALELSYNSQMSGDSSYNILFSIAGWSNCKNQIYCDYCFNGSNDCFGCIGLKKKQYCILNKQYTKEQYEALVPKIIEHMQKTGEWGKFFPADCSPFAYNETLAQEIMPLSKEEVIAHGWNWKEEEDVEPKDISFYRPEKSIESYQDESHAKQLLTSVLQCEVTGRPFRVTSQELAFYLRHNLPLPTMHPDQRHKERSYYYYANRRFERMCLCEQHEHVHHKETSCKKTFVTIYGEEENKKIYCEQCYKQEIY